MNYKGTSDLEHSEKCTSMKEAYHTENIWGKLVVKMRFHLSGLRFPASMRKSVLLLGQYLNCFWTCTRGLMSASDPILSLSLSSLLISVACPASSPWGREIVDPIEFSTVLDDDTESSPGVSMSRSENWSWRIIGFSIVFAPSYYLFFDLPTFISSIFDVISLFNSRQK